MTNVQGTLLPDKNRGGCRSLDGIPQARQADDEKKQVRRTVMPYLHTQQKIVFEGREDTASAPEHIDGKNEWLP